MLQQEDTALVTGLMGRVGWSSLWVLDPSLTSYVVVHMGQPQGAH